MPNDSRIGTQIQRAKSNLRSSQSAALTVVALPIRIKGSCHKRGTGVPFHIAGRWLPDGTTGGKAAQVPRPRVVRPATIHGAAGGVS